MQSLALTRPSHLLQHRGDYPNRDDGGNQVRPVKPNQLPILPSVAMENRATNEENRVIDQTLGIGQEGISEFSENVGRNNQHQRGRQRPKDWSPPRQHERVNDVALSTAVATPHQADPSRTQVADR